VGGDGSDGPFGRVARQDDEGGAERGFLLSRQCLVIWSSVTRALYEHLAASRHMFCTSMISYHAIHAIELKWVD
jgi:hypothetical protein